MVKASLPRIAIFSTDALFCEALQRLLEQTQQCQSFLWEKNHLSSEADLIIVDVDTVHMESLGKEVRIASVAQDGALTKPFTLKSLWQEMSRKLATQGREAEEIREGLWLDPVARQLAYQQAQAELTEKEMSLLQLLSAASAPIRHEEALERVWGYGEGMETTTLETHMYRLRKKLEGINAPYVIANEKGRLQLLHESA